MTEQTNRFQLKEQSYLQQINIYEEQVNQLQSRLTKEK